MNEIGKTGAVASKIGGSINDINKTATLDPIKGLAGDLSEDITKKADSIIQTKLIGGDIKSASLYALAPCITSELAKKENMSIGVDPRQIANIRGVLQASKS